MNIFLKSLAYLLLGVFLLQTFEVGIVVLRFKLNQAYIAKVLCVNKDVPGSHCNGCCQLKKEISQNEEQKTEKEAVEIGSKPLVFIEMVLELLPEKKEISLTRIWPTQTACLAIGNTAEIFRPPKIAWLPQCPNRLF